MPSATTTIPSVAEIAQLDLCETFVGVGGIEISVVHRYDVAEDTGAAQVVLATSDGRHVDWSLMHSGPESDADPVYYEAWGVAGTSHGWADAESRRVIQVG